MLVAVLTCGLLALLGDGDAAQPLVLTKDGGVLGSERTTADGSVVFEFLGIPFAQPPTGALRFEKPAPSKPWLRPLNATVYSAACVPCERSGKFSEDCLYLNVWTKDFRGNMPVLVFIHGGAYMAGSAAGHSAQKWREVYARRGIVVVTIQYRLGPFGFLTLNDSVIAPNLGLWDQNAALQWVQSNIAKFGGDAQRVTIYGESAGSASVSQQILSPRSKGLFQQAIEMSGSALANWANGRNTVPFSKIYLQKLGCDNHSNYKKCLQEKTVDDFLNVKAGWKGMCGPASLNWLGFTPIVDGDFLPAEPEVLLKSAASIPVIIGLNQVEGRAFTLEQQLPFSVPSPLEYALVTKKEFVAFVDTWIMSFGYPKTEQAAAASQILANFGSGVADDDHFKWIEQYTLTYSDWGMNVPAVREAIAKTTLGTRVFAFTFEQSNVAQWPKGLPCQGSTHAGEYPYALEMDANFAYTADDNAVKQLIQDLFIQFFTNGDPSLPNLQWPSYTQHNGEFLALGPKPSIKKDWWGPSYRFWTNTMHQFSFDFVSGKNWTAQ